MESLHQKQVRLEVSLVQFRLGKQSSKHIPKQEQIRQNAGGHSDALHRQGTTWRGVHHNGRKKKHTATPMRAGRPNGAARQWAQQLQQSARTRSGTVSLEKQVTGVESPVLAMDGAT